jgi:hypothetical protein
MFTTDLTGTMRVGRTRFRRAGGDQAPESEVA